MFESVRESDSVFWSVSSSVSESVCVNERETSSDRSFVKESERPFLDDVTPNEYVHAIVRVQVMVYVNDVDMSRVKDSNDCVLSEVKVRVCVSWSFDTDRVWVLSGVNVLVSLSVNEHRVHVIDQSRVSTYIVLESVNFVSARLMLSD